MTAMDTATQDARKCHAAAMSKPIKGWAASVWKSADHAVEALFGLNQFGQQLVEDIFDGNLFGHLANNLPYWIRQEWFRTYAFDACAAFLPPWMTNLVAKDGLKE